MWLVHSQTKRRGGTFVLGGMPLTYAEIAKRSSFSERNVRRWLDKLRKFNYVNVTYLSYKRLKIEVTKAKKWAPKQTQFSYRPLTVNGQSGEPVISPLNGQSSVPKVVSGLPLNGQSKQNCSLKHIESNGERLNHLSPQDQAAAEVFTECAKPAAASASHLYASLEQIRHAFEEIRTEPFGSREFQEIFADIAARDAPSGSDAMERTIQCCRAAGVTVPGRFFKLKHVIEKLDSEQLLKRTPI